MSAVTGWQPVAALYVETDGCYFGLPGVDPWDQKRDARLYAGPHPVVAHPPCQRWGQLGAINYARWGGEHNRPGNDGGCFASALNAVRTYGGVLEHPAKSRAWSAYDLAKPDGHGWQRCIDGGWVCEVWQSAYGHPANKATWLYAYGVVPPDLNWARVVGTHQVGRKRSKGISKPHLNQRGSAATPVAFREVLLTIARSVHAATSRAAA